MKKISSRQMDVWCCLFAAIGFAIIGFTVSNDSVNVYFVEERNETSLTPTDRSNDCLIHNSYTWLKGRRMSNGDKIPNGLFRPFSSFSELLPHLAQSLADKRSSFVNTSFPGISSDRESQSIHQWAVKLIFIAIQYHQHRPARQEAELRYQDTSSKRCRLYMKHHSVGNSDYECADTKFIVGGLTANGLGSNVRAAISTLIMSGLVSNRTVVLIQNGKEGPKFIRKAWKLSSCIRRDFQCVFLPLSLCLPTWEMVANAFVLDKPYQYYFGDGHIRNIPESEMDNRVWVLQKYGVTEVPPRTATDILAQYIQELFENIPLGNGQRRFFQKVLRYISDSTSPKRNSSRFTYPAAANVVNHASAVFALRPNFQSRKKLEEIMQEITPPNESSSSFIGLPIRASDKCHRESECLSFTDHMKAVGLAKYRLPIKYTSGETILFTSESVEMTNEQKAYSKNSSDRFLVNFRDVTPGSGLISEVLDTGRFTADESMIAALRVSPRRCYILKIGTHKFCSFLVAGLGTFSDADPVCLQDFGEPELMLCCGWEMAECQARKRSLLP